MGAVSYVCRSYRAKTGREIFWSPKSGRGTFWTPILNSFKGSISTFLSETVCMKAWYRANLFFIYFRCQFWFQISQSKNKAAFPTNFFEWNLCPTIEFIKTDFIENVSLILKVKTRVKATTPSAHQMTKSKLKVLQQMLLAF